MKRLTLAACLLIPFTASMPAQAADDYAKEQTPEAERQAKVVATAFGLPPATDDAPNISLFKGTDQNGAACYVSVSIQRSEYRVSKVECEMSTSNMFHCYSGSNVEYLRKETTGYDSTVQTASTARKQRIFGSATVIWNKYKNVQHTPLFKKYQNGWETTARVKTAEDGTISITFLEVRKEGESGLFAGNVGTNVSGAACKGMRALPYHDSDLQLDRKSELNPQGDLRAELYGSWKKAHEAADPVVDDESDKKPSEVPAN